MTFEAMTQVVSENLKLEGVTGVTTPAIHRRLNRAKDEVVALIENEHAGEFLATTTVAVTLGDASFALPADFRRLISLRRIDSDDTTYQSRVRIIDARDIQQWHLAKEPAVFRRRTVMAFANKDGAPDTMTVELEYERSVPDLAEATKTSAFDDIDAEFHPIITDKATLALIPGQVTSQRGVVGTAPARIKYLEDVREGIDLMRAALRRNRTDTSPPKLKRVW